MKTRTPVTIAVTGALIAGAVATGVIFHQHNQGISAFEEAHAKLTEKVEAVETERHTATTDLAEAQVILDRASQPGALAQTTSRVELDAAVKKATEQISEYDELLAEPVEVLSDTERDGLFWQGDLDAAAETMLERFYALSASSTPRISLGSVRPVQAELDRTADIVTAEEKIANTPAAQDSSGSYRPTAEKLATAAGFSVHHTPAGGDACNGTQPQGDVAGFVCPGTTEIWVIADATLESSPYYDVLIRHELAHLLIYERCGVFDPPEAGERFEAVTSSYAALFLGADIDQLRTTASPAYTMTQETHAAARQIHDAGCAA